MKKLILSLMVGISCASAMDETANEKTKLGNTIAVNGNASLSSAAFNILMVNGAYPEGRIDYTLLQAGETLATTGTVTLNWVTPKEEPFGAKEVVKTSEGQKYLVLKYTIDDHIN
ncbi:MAG: hypothetical protein V4544_01300 [Pseudomonadota bacterium]